jgi:hypothetical protein
LGMLGTHDSFSFFNLPSFIVVLCGGTLWHLWRFLECIIYIILEFIPSATLLYSFTTTVIISAFTYMYTRFFHHIHPPTTFPHYLPAPTTTNIPPLSRTCSALLLSDFSEKKRKQIKRKTWHFCLFAIKVVTQVVSLWYFHVYICYTHSG